MILRLIGCVVLGSVLGRVSDAPPYPFDLESRLASLSPGDPRGYFELAEEVLDVAGADPERRALARRLFGLSGVLDAEGFGASAALALAAMADDSSGARRYLVVARLLRGDSRSDGRIDAEALDRQTVTRICRGLEDFRAGRMDRIRSILRDPALVRVLDRWDATLPGGVAWLRDRSARGAGERIDLDLRERMALVDVEIALIEGANASWATLISTGAARPLMDLPLERPETVLLPEEQIGLFHWRNGVWTDRP